MKQGEGDTMSDNRYPPSGALFTVAEDKRKSEKSPHYQGDFELPREVVEDLYKQIQSDPTTDRAKCRLVGWRQTARKSGNTFVTSRQMSLKKSLSKAPSRVRVSVT